MNIKKCKFLQKSIGVLGVTLEGDNYQLGEKSLARLFASQLPRNLTDLQSLVGKLNHCAPFVPDFRRTIKPIIGIMGGDTFGKWREEQTAALNTLAGLIRAQLRLRLVDRSRELLLYIDCDDKDMSVVLGHSPLEVCAMAGRALTASEVKGVLIERMLATAVWGYKRFRRYCEYQPVRIMFPHAAEIATVTGADSPAKIK